MRAQRSWRPRIAESWVRTCACRRQRSLGTIPGVLVLVAPIRVREDTVTASATTTVELGFRQKRTTINRQDEAQNATGESVLCALSLFLFLSVYLSRSLESASFWLSSPQSRNAFRLAILLTRSVFRKLIPYVLERGAIAAAKRSEDATPRPHDFRGESWVLFLWLAP